MYQVTLCTCPTMTIAQDIAQQLVTEKLAACVSILPGVVSVYRWQDNVVSETEVQLLIKSKSTYFDLLNDRIKQLHPYDTPEVIALNIQQGDHQYLNWINESLK
ncbi:divalent-cation tolerance protein CutA [Colwellia sp. Arc7-635]|uniref:divalent-cation tolerance protein CutA n=1 Tax=Colwellia sp. Arc7-635 TaxID=2497879 RepID=UPI000F859F43|nr:divalent-cation tolerance protein CutA [Colwellia sp. Arc7-635]AZQ83145.1 divalent-cation tolerance protein CutA [Colwellia sp. Arc7-635]